MAAPEPPESLTTRVLSLVAGALDRTVLQGMTLAYEAALVPALDDYPSLRASAHPYTDPILERDPRRFFAFLERPHACAIPTGIARRPIEGGAIVTRRMPSRYVPYHPIADEDPCPANATVWMEHWMHEPGPPRATMLVLHGFTMGRPRIDAHLMMVDRWYRLGVDVVQLVLPFHGARASERCRYSGERFASWHVGRLNEAVRQSVHDAHAVLRWLAETTAAPVGVLGMSLGGYLTALLAALEPRLAFAIPVVPAVCLADLPTRLFACSRAGRTGVLPPMTRLELQRAYRAHSPLSYPLALPSERVLVVGARGDGVTPFAQAQALWEHWQRPSAVWFSGGHVTPFQRSRVAVAVARHLRALDVIDAPDGPSAGLPRPMLVGLPARKITSRSAPSSWETAAARAQMRLVTPAARGPGR